MYLFIIYIFRHRFPVNDEKSLKIWLNRVGNKDLELLERSKLYERYICSSHFIPECVGGRSRLIKYSLPAVNLPGKINHKPYCKQIYIIVLLFRF